MNIFDPKYISKLLKKKGLATVAIGGAAYATTYVFHMLMSQVYLEKLKSLPSKMSIPAALAFANTGCNGVFKPLQVQSEITGLLKYVKALKPKVLVEIGTANGGTLFSLIKVSTPELIAVSIDLPSGEFGGGYAWYKIPLLKAFVSKKQQMHLLRADSHSLETKKQLEQILGKKKIDFLLIDGDHTYKGVKKDYDLYSPLVRKGGSIAFHDIVPHAKEFNCGVDKLWKQLKSKSKHTTTFVENWKQGFCGIGVIRKTK